MMNSIVAVVDTAESVGCGVEVAESAGNNEVIHIGVRATMLPQSESRRYS